MVLLPSGFREDVELVHIETMDFSLLIKGKPFHERYEGLKQYRRMDLHDVMEFSVTGNNIESVKVYDVNLGQLTSDYKLLRPIFFENGIYQLIVIQKNEKKLTFNHEHPLFRQAISPMKLGKQVTLMGNLHFQNEIGFSTFQIQHENEVLLEVTLEIFPSKLDYKKDYQKLIEEVNEEIYNLAFHFIRKTYLGARTKLEGNPSRTEFFRLISRHFTTFIQSINRIEQQPHHKLSKNYVKARGDQLRKLDSRSRSFLRKNSNLFVDVENGIPIGYKQFMPTEGLRIKKVLTYDTLENRYVKWMIERLIHKLTDLLETIKKNLKNLIDADLDVINQVEQMADQLQSRLKQSFWKNVGKLDRSAFSLVMQMAPGYREAFQIYLTVSKGLVLQGKIYKMSVKDVATLYEYWTFLKLGQILGRKYTMISQDIVQVKRDGLFVNLETNKMARRVFQHPITKEEITLTYQKYEGNLPTTAQKPDTMLSIEKKGKDYTFNYIFDAKYRIDYALEGSYYQLKYQIPGPMEEDINTMHRYRDSIVAVNNGPYERTAFGAYVLFPWFDEDAYQEHHFYKSINQVNIGALPFLPNATRLVERFVERLIDKSPEELQKQGILPRGTDEEWKSSLDPIVLVGLVSTKEEYMHFIHERNFSIDAKKLKKGWQKAEYVALYLKKGVVPEQHGVFIYGKIEEVTPLLKSKVEVVQFRIEHWINLPEAIKPVNYGIANYILTTLNTLKEAKELPELFMKSKEEMMLWRMLRRVSDRIRIQLNDYNLDKATQIVDYKIKGISVKVNKEKREVLFISKNLKNKVTVDQFKKNPSGVFRLLMNMME